MSSTILTACQKELEFDTPPGSGGGTGGGGTTGTDYQPVTAASEWNYVSTGPTGSYKVVSIGTDSLIGGKSFYRFNNVTPAGTSRSYINKESGVYTTYASGTTSGGITIPNLTLIYLKDAAVGTTWTNVISYMGTASNHKYTVTAKGLTKTVLTKSYSNVIELGYALSVANPLGGPDIQVGEGKYYFAKGVGFIESDLMSGFGPAVLIDTTRLSSYTIN